jgi:hypothetical protein
MHRQNRKSTHRAGPALDAILHQREGRPFCPKCQQFVKHKDAVWVARRQCRCPTCGELLERRVDDGPATAALRENGQPAEEQNRPA